MLRMLKKINPFKGILGPQHARHALTLNTTYWQKVKNTYTVLSGTSMLQVSDGWGFLAAGERYRYGILDFIPFLGADILLSKISMLSFILKSLRKKLPFAARLPVVLVFAIPFFALNVAIAATRVALQTVRFFAALAITAVAAVAIVPVVQGFASWAYNSLMDIIGKMTSEQSNSPDVNIADQIKNDSLDLSYDPANKSTTLFLERELNTPILNKITRSAEDVICLTSNSDANTRGMNALLQLNYRSIANKVEANRSWEAADPKGLEDGHDRHVYRV